MAMPNSPPVVATAHSTVRAIIPAETETFAADHDYHVYLKITPSTTAVLNTREESSESLLVEVLMDIAGSSFHFTVHYLPSQTVSITWPCPCSYYVLRRRSLLQ